MEILRIPSAYYTQIQFLNKEDSEYVLKTIFALSFGEKIKVEKSMRGGLVISIWREAIQMENKARAKKGEERLNEDLATLSCDTDDTLGSSKDATNSSQEKSIQINSNQENITDVTAIAEPKKDNRNVEINEAQELLKQECISLGIVYKAGGHERERIKNILTAIDYGELCERMKMTRIEFALNIMRVSTKLDFWNGKIYNAETIYKHYALVYNEAKKQKEELQKTKKSPFIV